MKVTRLPVDPGPATWNDILPKQKSCPVLDRKLTADWVVIGAGFAGLPAARRLALMHVFTYGFIRRRPPLAMDLRMAPKPQSHCTIGTL